ncbi:hypothetical protein D3C80_1420090 [compost metagenome]
MVFCLVSSCYEVALVPLLNRYNLLFEANIGLEQIHLPGQVVYQLLCGDFRETSHIVNIFFRIKGSELPPQLGHAFNKGYRRLAHTAVEGGKHAGRTAAYN